MTHKQIIRLNISLCRDEDKKIFQEVIEKKYRPIDIFRNGMVVILNNENKKNK